MSRKTGLMCALAAVWSACCCCSAPAFALSEGRVYEMVSPVYKAGHGVAAIDAVAPDGNRVAFESLGTFAGALNGSGLTLGTYLSRREPTEWSTASIAPPVAIAPLILYKDFTPTLEYSLTRTATGANHGVAEFASPEDVFWLHPMSLPDLGSGFEVAGMGVKSLTGEHVSIVAEGESPDFCHIVFDAGLAPLLPEAAGAEAGQLYDLNRGCGGSEPWLRLVELNSDGNAISPHCPGRLGGGGGSEGEKFSAISRDSSEVFFTAHLVNDCTLGAHQLFLRLGGTRTIEVSRPLSEACGKVPCPKAALRSSSDFQGANEEGTEVFFTTSQALVDEDKDQTGDLYMARIGCAGAEACEPAQRTVTSIVLVSHGREAADVRGVVKVAPDGARVYFVARGVLSETPNAEGRLAAKGAENLYVYDVAANQSTFIGDICSDVGLSGEMVDRGCGGSDIRLLSHFEVAQTADADGRFLVFPSFAQLAGGDTDTAADIYRYDAQSGALDRVTIGEEGFDANGNNSEFDAHMARDGGVSSEAGEVARQYLVDDRAITEDGSRIVFMTSEPLSPAATNGLQNVYEWHKQPGWSEGEVSMISSGTAEEPDRQVVMSPSGSDIFFITDASLTQQDTDEAIDIYDARINGGFPAPPAAREPCSGDACQGPLTNPAPLLVPGSAVQAASGPVSNAKSKHAAKPRPRKIKRRPRRTHRRRGKPHGRRAARGGRGVR